MCRLPISSYLLFMRFSSRRHSLTFVLFRARANKFQPVLLSSSRRCFLWKICCTTVGCFLCLFACLLKYFVFSACLLKYFVLRRFGKVQPSRPVDFVSAGETPASSHFSGSPITRSRNFQWSTYDEAVFSILPKLRSIKSDLLNFTDNQDKSRSNVAKCSNYRCC